MAVIHEGFADRGYLGTGQLVPRDQPGAVHEMVDAMVAQALDLADGHVTPVDGDRIPVAVDSLCVHGDTPGAVAAARAIRAALEARGWQVASPGSRRDGSASRPGPRRRIPQVHRGRPADPASGRRGPQPSRRPRADPPVR